MLKAFKVNSIDYLLKPIKKEELDAALTKYKSLHSAAPTPTTDSLNEIISQIKLGGTPYKSRFLVKQGDKMLAIKSQDIVCFQSKHGIVHIVTKNEKSYLSDFTLDDLMSHLDPSLFCRANRQFIVHIDYINTVHKYFKGKLMLEMDHFEGDQIIVSTEKATAFKQWMDQ